MSKNDVTVWGADENTILPFTLLFTHFQILLSRCCYMIDLELIIPWVKAATFILFRSGGYFQAD